MHVEGLHINDYNEKQIKDVLAFLLGVAKSIKRKGQQIHFLLPSLNLPISTLW